MTTEVHDRPINQHDRSGQVPYGRYRAVSRMAVASLAFGVLSSVAVWWYWAMELIPGAGILLGYLALRGIEKASGELTGRGLAWAGLILSVVFGVAGCGWQVFAKMKEFPRGYEEITHADLQPDPSTPLQQIPPKAFESQYDEFQGKRVGIKGFMAPTRQQFGLKQFVLCPSIPNCPSCTPNPKPTEMIVVRLEGDLRARYTTHEIRVGGKFRVDDTFPNGVAYYLDADYLQY